MKLAEYQRLMDSLHVSDEAVHQLLRSAYGPSRRPAVMALRTALIAAVVVIMSMTVALAVSPTLQQTLHMVLGVRAELPEYTEADSQELFEGKDFRVNVLSFARGLEHAQLFVFAAPFTQEQLSDSRWNLVVRTEQGVTPANAEIVSMVYDGDAGGGILQLDIANLPDGAQTVEYGLTNMQGGVPSFATWFHVSFPETRFLELSCDTPLRAGNLEGTLRSAQVTLNALSLEFEIPDIQETYELAAHIRPAEHDVWEKAYQTEKAWEALLEDYRVVTLHFADGSHRAISCVWNAPDGADHITLSAIWEEDWISIEDVVSITINEQTYPVQ